MIKPEPDHKTQAASVGREATENPDEFLIPGAELPEGFRDRVKQGSEGASEPIPAATVILMRPAAAGPEVLLLQRPARSSFAADAWVFPGGRVDEADGDSGITELWDGRSARQWQERLHVGTETEAVAYVAAAIREAWEETGIILATSCIGSPERLEVARREILADSLSLRLACEREGIRLSTDDLLYIAHWVTPAPEPRRYDTRFFLARVAEDTACLLHGNELVQARWIRPGEAVRLHAGSRLKLLPPTLHTLRRLAEFASLDAMWTALRNAHVPRILPVMRADPRGIIIAISP